MVIGQLAFLAVVPTAAADASASCAERLAARVQARYDSVRDFSADFVQTTKAALFESSGGDLAPPSRGEVVLAKPGKMRWTYDEPERSLVVSDGTTLWLYSPDLKEAQRLPVTKGYLTGAALQFLLGEGKLLESFTVSTKHCPFDEKPSAGGAKEQPAKTAGPSAAGGGTAELVLVPREPSSYERLGITVRVATGEIVETRVIDLFGNETTIAFSNILQNRDPAPETFAFSPPADAEVIELEAAP